MTVSLTILSPIGIGIPALIANWTDKQQPAQSGIDATSELNFLLYTDGRTDKGAMSHRRPPQPVQLWSDFLSMFPPFISYYGKFSAPIKCHTLSIIFHFPGALHSNEGLLLEGYNQVKLYRDALLDGSGLFQHIILGNDTQDYDHWSTGNSWAVNGMIRVLRIIQLSQFSDKTHSQQADLINWATTLLNNIWSHQQPDGSILNYIDMEPKPGLVKVFPESSGTALAAACTYRLAAWTLNYNWSAVGKADKARQYILSKIGSDGWLEGVVDPLNWAAPGQHSPEGQAFTLMLAAAWRDYTAQKNGNSC